MKFIFLLSLFTATLSATLPTSAYDVKTFGAAGDRQTLDTVAIQQAIDAAHAAGGGTVYFPTGTFLSGSIVLKSNVTLHLSPGATLLGSGNFADYAHVDAIRAQLGAEAKPAAPSEFHPELPGRHLIYAYDAENIGIEGAGTIDGQSAAFFDAAMKPRPRPSPLIEFQSSRRIRVENVTIRNAPAWTLRPKNCDDVKIRGISLLNSLRAINSDGIDVDSSRNVIIADSRIECGDDCIVLKTTMAEGVARPVENVVVTNCVLMSSASAIKLGTESHGDFRHCSFTNCVIRDSRTGIALLAKDGGTMEDIRFSNITITTRPKWGQGWEWPIVVDIERRTEHSRLSRIRDVAFSDLTIYTKGRIMVSGKPASRVENVSFRNVTMRVTGYEELAGAPKMSGGGAKFADGLPDYAETPAAFILVHLRSIRIDGLFLHWPVTATPPAREAIFQVGTEEFVLTAIHPSSGALSPALFRPPNEKQHRATEHAEATAPH